jgi:hypothetical protein
MTTSYTSILLECETVSPLRLFQIFRKKFVFKILEVLSTMVEIMPLENAENITAP